MSQENTPLPPRDSWASGSAYELYVGRWSRQVAPEFISWLAIPAGASWLDIGCGTGALSQAILTLAAPSAVKGVDRSDEFIAFDRANFSDPRVSFEVADAQSLPGDAETYDAVASALVLNFIPDSEKALVEMARVARPAGVVAAYVWDYAGLLQFMRHFWNAAAALEPKAFDLDEGRRFPLCKPAPLNQVFKAAGLRNVEVRAIDIHTDFTDFDDYWQPFLGGVGPAPSYAMSLNEAQRASLRERLRASLPFAPDGSIPLVARVWAVRGVK